MVWKIDGSEPRARNGRHSVSEDVYWIMLCMQSNVSVEWKKGESGKYR